MYAFVNDNAIGDMVDTFYTAIRHDPLLGPIFVDAIGDEWTAHLTKMKAFWSSVLLASRSYKGNPMIAHLRLPRLTETHFERWLELWRITAEALCSKQLAQLFVERAETIGARLLYTISQFHDPTVRAAAEAMSGSR
jgi:hemoglobin